MEKIIISDSLAEEAVYRLDYPGADEYRIDLDRQGLSLGGSSILPVMGELHYSRLPRQSWRETLLAMKAGGIKIVASYVFWNHHEEIEGEFDWSDRRDLRAFLELCGQLDLWVFLRLGPWCHGEVRYGGFPDWLIRKVPLGRRSDTPRYMKYVSRFMSSLLKQTKGLGWNDKGPILGVQLENEYHIRSGRGVSYLMKLKQAVIESGLKIPVYGLTGWPRSRRYPFREFLPFWGDYPAEPWAQHFRRLDRSSSFRFSRDFAPRGIGTDLLGKGDRTSRDREFENPYCLAELGVGNQITDHRRPLITADDAYAMALVKAGSGASWPGYYMFAGGSNPPSRRTSLQESRKTGYPNNLPRISYDFQAPLGEYGDRREIYHRLKNLHYALSDFASILNGAVLQINPDESGLPWAYRGTREEGFLFVNNHNRYGRSESIPGKCFEISRGDQKSLIGPLTIPKDASFYWPVGLRLGEGILRYATAQPLGIRKSADWNEYFLTPTAGVKCELLLENFKSLKVLKGEWIQESDNEGGFRVCPALSSEDVFPVLQLSDKCGVKTRIVIIPEDRAPGFWKQDDHVFFGGEALIFTEDGASLSSENRLIQGGFWNSLNAEWKREEKVCRQVERDLNIGHLDLPLKTGTEASLSSLESVNLHYTCSGNCTILINGKKRVRLKAGSGIRSLRKGWFHGKKREFSIELSPAEAGEACLELSDQRGHQRRYYSSSSRKQEKTGDKSVFAPIFYELKTGNLSSEEADLCDHRLYLHYYGDKAELRCDGVLLADHFNQGSPWMVSLERLKAVYGKDVSTLELRLYPRKKSRKIYLEGSLPKDKLQEASLKSWEIRPLYRKSFHRTGEEK